MACATQNAISKHALSHFSLQTKRPSPIRAARGSIPTTLNLVTDYDLVGTGAIREHRVTVKPPFPLLPPVQNAAGLGEQLNRQLGQEQTERTEQE